MISVDYNKETHAMNTRLQGDSDILLMEFKCLTDHILDVFHVYGQEIRILDLITDVISEFAEKHTPKSKGE